MTALVKLINSFQLLFLSTYILIAKDNLETDDFLYIYIYIGLIDWCLTPTLAVFQLYRDVIFWIISQINL